MTAKLNPEQVKAEVGSCWWREEPARRRATGPLHGSSRLSAQETPLCRAPGTQKPLSGPHPQTLTACLLSVLKRNTLGSAISLRSKIAVLDIYPQSRILSVEF